MEHVNRSQMAMTKEMKASGILKEIKIFIKQNL